MLLNVIKFVSLFQGCLVDYVVKNNLKTDSHSVDCNVPVKSWSNIFQCVGMSVAIIPAQHCQEQMHLKTGK